MKHSLQTADRALKFIFQTILIQHKCNLGKWPDKPFALCAFSNCLKVFNRLIFCRYLTREEEEKTNNVTKTSKTECENLLALQSLPRKKRHDSYWIIMKARHFTVHRALHIRRRNEDKNSILAGVPLHALLPGFSRTRFFHLSLPFDAFHAGYYCYYCHPCAKPLM